MGLAMACSLITCSESMSTWRAAISGCSRPRPAQPSSCSRSWPQLSSATFLQVGGTGMLAIAWGATSVAELPVARRRRPFSEPTQAGMRRRCARFWGPHWHWQSGEQTRTHRQLENVKVLLLLLRVLESPPPTHVVSDADARRFRATGTQESKVK